jgi:hypothetical protein
VTGGGVGVEPPSPVGEPEEGGGVPVPPLVPEASEGAEVDDVPADGVVLDELLVP